MKRLALVFSSTLLLSAFTSAAVDAASLPALPTFSVPQAPVYTPPAKPNLPTPPKAMSAASFFALVKKK